MVRSRQASPLIALVVVFATAACDAPHSNPLDPLSPDFENVGVLEGTVTNRSFEPIADVTVTRLPDGATTTTQPDGTFTFGGVAPGPYTVVVAGTGLVADTTSVHVELAQVTSHAFILNALPAVTDAALTTVHISRWWPAQDLFRLDVETGVSDPDGLADVSGVSLDIPAAGYATALQPSTEAGVFVASLTEADVGTSLHGLLGRDILVTVTDQAGGSISAGPWYLTRIIDYVPETISPSASQEVPGGSPLLEWEAAQVPFEHEYRVDVYRVDDDVATIVYTVHELADSQLSHQVADTLPVGSYYWTISVVDEYGNRSRSREAGFLVP